MTREEIAEQRNRKRLELYPNAMYRARRMLAAMHDRYPDAATDIREVYDVLGNAFDEVMKIGHYAILPGDAGYDDYIRWLREREGDSL